MKNVRSLTPKAEEVLAFWFGGAGTSRREWFVKDEAFDGEIRRRFGTLHEQAVSRELDGWRGESRSALALLILLDQFSRNLHRGHARSFEADAYALEIARELVAKGFDKEMLPVERQFVYLPFEHSEDPGDQERALALMQELDGFPETKGVSEWARKHLVIIERFGRFPHRNAALGRASTAEEREFLTQPGSGF